MEAKDYTELQQMIELAGRALVSGTLTDWQHANTSTFHILASMILDLNDRINRGDYTSSLADTGDLYNGI